MLLRTPEEKTILWHMAILQHPASPSLDDLQVPRIVDIQVFPSEEEQARRIAFFAEHHRELMASHADEFVAVCSVSGDVIAADGDIFEVYRQLERLGADGPETWVELVTDTRPIHYL